MSGDTADLTAQIAALSAEINEELIEIQQDIHAHPELSWQEYRTTELVAERLRQAGLEPHLFESTTGLYCDIGSGEKAVALRADLDALPVAENSGVDYTSTVAGVAHACGHDVHTTMVLGAGLILAKLNDAGLLGHRVRLIFQPAEEVQPGGALRLIEQGVLGSVCEIFALHCDPKIDVGQVGTRIGPITSASDEVDVIVRSHGGHTSRPHLTGDVVYALAQIITQLPAILGRRLDPRSGVNLTWGSVQSGSTHNAIPSSGVARGTLRCLDADASEQAASVIAAAAQEIAAPYGVEVELRHTRGVPPVINDDTPTRVLDNAVREVVGVDNLILTEQSLGGEDFAWYTQRVPGSMARLGVRPAGAPIFDIHSAEFVADQSAIAIGSKLLATVAIRTSVKG